MTLAGGRGFYIGVGEKPVEAFACGWPVQWLEFSHEMNEVHVYVPYSGTVCSKQLWVDTCFGTISVDSVELVQTSNDETSYLFPGHIISTLLTMTENVNRDENASNSEESSQPMEAIVTVEQTQLVLEKCRPTWKKVCESGQMQIYGVCIYHFLDVME